MIRMVEMDDAVPIRDQFGDTSDQPVLLVNILHVPPAEVDALLAAWTDDANSFKAQPGFISTQLHRGIGGSGTFMDYAVWQSVAAFRAAFTSPEFQTKLAAYPDHATISPHLFRHVAVDRVCVA